MNQCKCQGVGFIQLEGCSSKPTEECMNMHCLDCEFAKPCVCIEGNKNGSEQKKL